MCLELSSASRVGQMLAKPIILLSALIPRQSHLLEGVLTILGCVFLSIDYLEHGLVYAHDVVTPKSTLTTKPETHVGITMLSAIEKDSNGNTLAQGIFTDKQDRKLRR